MVTMMAVATVTIMMPVFRASTPMIVAGSNGRARMSTSVGIKVVNVSRSNLKLIGKAVTLHENFRMKDHYNHANWQK